MQEEKTELNVSTLVLAYSNGLFPMSPARDSPVVEWYRPQMRGVMPLDTFHCPKNVKKEIRRERFQICSNRAFGQVIEYCAQVRKGDGETWINDAIIKAYIELNQRGLAHSIEAWLDDELVGGLYGVCFKGVFFGESMFHIPEKGGTNASKVCLTYLVDHMKRQRYHLLDTQLVNPHLMQFGVVEIPHHEYMRWLGDALMIECDWRGFEVGQHMPRCVSI